MDLRVSVSLKFALVLLGSAHHQVSVHVETGLLISCDVAFRKHSSSAPSGWRRTLRRRCRSNNSAPDGGDQFPSLLEWHADLITSRPMRCFHEDFKSVRFLWGSQFSTSHSNFCIHGKRERKCARGRLLITKFRIFCEQVLLYWCIHKKTLSQPFEKKRTKQSFFREKNFLCHRRHTVSAGVNYS